MNQIKGPDHVETVVGLQKERHSGNRHYPHNNLHRCGSNIWSWVPITDRPTKPLSDRLTSVVPCSCRPQALITGLSHVHPVPRCQASLQLPEHGGPQKSVTAVWFKAAHAGSVQSFPIHMQVTCGFTFRTFHGLLESVQGPGRCGTAKAAHSPMRAVRRESWCTSAGTSCAGVVVPARPERFKPHGGGTHGAVHGLSEGVLFVFNDETCTSSHVMCWGYSTLT